MKLFIHVAKLVYRKYHLSWVFLGMCSLLFIPVLAADWVTLKASFNFEFPLSDHIFPSLSSNLNGFRLMGYFSFLPLFPVVLALIAQTRKHAWISLLFIMLFSLVHLANVADLHQQLSGTVSQLLAFDSHIHTPVYLYFVLHFLQLIFTYLLSRIP